MYPSQGNHGYSNFYPTNNNTNTNNNNNNNNNNGNGNSNSNINSNSNSDSSRSSYKGVRRRKSGKWVSEIREPKKPTRIWLGSYPTPEMAAVAYDVAALALKGPGTQLNFPDSSPSFPVPHSPSPRDIQAAAASAAAAAGAAANALGFERRENFQAQNDEIITNDNDKGKSSGDEYFLDEDLIFDMPNVLANMAQGMLLSLPPLDVPLYDDEDDDEYDVGSCSGNHSLWNHP